MIWWIILIAFVFLFVVCVPFRIAVFHPFGVAKNAIVDFYLWLKHKGYNTCSGGQCICYTGLFGRGKTLSAVHLVRSNYLQYNDKPVWCMRRKKMVKQKIAIMSNVVFTDIPYIYLTSLADVVSWTKTINDLDDKNGTLTTLFVLIDESSVVLNSRNFKSNINAMFLNSLLTCRHYGGGISFITTSQRFSLEDALLRQVTQEVRDCRKTWRFQIINRYDAFDLENASNIELVSPLSRGGFFVFNRDYHSYDTHAVVEDLQKKFEENDLLSDGEILANQAVMPSDNEGISHKSRKLKKLLFPKK